MDRKEAMSFLHDSNARNDMKILEIRSIYGWEGYGLYFALIEILREQSDYKLKLKGNRVLSIQLQPFQLDISTLIKKCIEIDLFETDNEFFWSESLLKRMAAFNEARYKMSEGGKKGMKRRYKQDITSLKGSYKGTKDNINKNKNNINKNKVKEIIDYLNLKANKKYKYNNNINIINARLKEGYKIEDFKYVVDIKCPAWINDVKMEKYLKPSTLFCKTHFDDYLNEKSNTEKFITPEEADRQIELRKKSDKLKPEYTEKIGDNDG